jgi:DNA-binding IclR family transcriptional regulator
MKELRIKILVHLEQHARSRTDQQYYVDDASLAVATGAPLHEVRRALDTLEAQGLIESANTMDNWSAAISPRGSLAVEEMADQVIDAVKVAAKAKIGF